MVVIEQVVEESLGIKFAAGRNVFKRRRIGTVQSQYRQPRDSFKF
jgi:hypothetical protein